MSPLVMAVVLGAAFLHATWNFLVKNTEDKARSMTAVVLGHAPFAVAAVLWAPLPDPESIPCVLAGAGLHVGYQLFLLASYRVGDLSQVYPLARGAAPLLVTLVSVPFFGERLSGVELGAVGIIAAGIMSLTLVRRRDGRRGGPAIGLALVTGCFIASYSVVDGIGARLAGTALGYYGWLSIANAAVFAVIMTRRRPGLVGSAFSEDWRLTLSSGGASFLAYALVTWAFTRAPLPLVAAVRETSILAALLLGVVLLRERFDTVKAVATVTTLLGIVLLHLSR